MKVIDITNHFRNLVESGAIYVWGGNCETITAVMIEKLYNSYHTEKYNRYYYDYKLQEGEGKPGADCSGAFFPVSGYDTTANGYFNKCVETGKISTLPRGVPCAVFIKQGGRMVHVGWYDGAGSVYEMRSSVLNARHDAISSRWTHWGKPDFAEYEEETFSMDFKVLKRGDRGTQVKALQALLTGFGYSCGSSGCDGIFGANTEKGVKKFQSAKKITVDGEAGKNTFTKLLLG